MCKLRTILNGLLFLTLMVLGFSACQSNSTGNKEKEILPLEMPDEMMMSSKDSLENSRARKNKLLSTSNIVTYDFNDLTYSCGWQLVPNIPNPYHGLQFEEDAYWAVCNYTNLGNSQLIRPANYNKRFQYTTDVITLPEPAREASLDIYHSNQDYNAALIALDANGNEIQRAENTQIQQWQELTVSPGTEIYQIGIYAHNPNTLFDNLIVDYGTLNSPPTADAGSDQVIEASGLTTSVSLNGSASSDPDDDDLGYTWSLNGSEIATGVNPDVDLELGEHIITLTVDDGNGETASDEVTIKIQDTTAPELSYTVERTSLWPANHKMVVSLSNISASDIYDPAPVTSVIVNSNEDANGKGDGNTDSDWEVTQNSDGSYEVKLRAERSGRGSGRVYSVTISSTDSSGNTSEEIVEVSVLKSKGKGNS